MSVHIHIVGRPDEVAKAVLRHEEAFDVVGHSPQKPAREGHGQVVVHLEAEVDRHE